MPYVPACHSSRRTISSSSSRPSRSRRLCARAMRAIWSRVCCDRRRAVDAEHAARSRPAARSRRPSPPASSPSPSRRRSCRRRRRARAPAAATSSAQRAKPRPPSGWSDAPAGIGYGLPPAASTESSASSQLGRNAMSKPASDEPDVGAHDPREQDVADRLVDGVVPVDPVLLHEHALQVRAARRPRRPGACGSTARRRSTRACRSPARARPRRGTRACASCCRRTRARSCSRRASPRSRRGRRGARSAVRADARATGRRGAASRGKSASATTRR